MATRQSLIHRGVEHAIEVSSGTVSFANGETLECATGSGNAIRIGGDPPHQAWAVTDGDEAWVFLEGRTYVFTRGRPGATRTRRRDHGALSAPMPATVRRIEVEPGQQIAAGDTLILLEAMKMELPIRAGTDGVVRAIRCREGDLVQPGVALIEISPLDATG